MSLEEEATRRAVEGCKRLVLHNGQPVLDDQGQPIVEMQFSDRLLELLLKRHFPEAYREKLASIVSTATANASANATSDEELATYQATRAALLARMGDDPAAGA